MEPMQRLRITAQYVHALALGWGWDTDRSLTPHLYVLDYGRGTGRYDLDLVPVPADVWDQAPSPAHVIEALTVEEPFEPFRGAVFTSEAWMITGNAKDEAEVLRAIEDGRNRRVKDRPDRISVRTTFAIDRYDNAVALNSEEGGAGATVWDSERNDHAMHRTRTMSAIPRALGNLVDRLAAATDAASPRP